MESISDIFLVLRSSVEGVAIQIFQTNFEVMSNEVFVGISVWEHFSKIYFLTKLLDDIVAYSNSFAMMDYRKNWCNTSLIILLEQ